VTDTNVMRLAELPELRDLDLRQTGVTRYRLRRLLQFPRLKSVRVGASVAVYSAGEGKEVEAFIEDLRAGGVLADVEYE
jgi:hypothetical protein